jgi:membrane associated rhomboid family serine protease
MADGVKGGKKMKKRHPIYLILAILMLILIYPAYCKNGASGAVSGILAAVLDLTIYLQED